MGQVDELTTLLALSQSIQFITLGIELALVVLLLPIRGMRKVTVPPKGWALLAGALLSTVTGLVTPDSYHTPLLALLSLLLTLLLLPSVRRSVTEKPVGSENPSFHDALTDLPNRQAFYEHLQTSLAVAGREQFGVGLLYLDLDHFKEVNDTYGHDVGDRVIAETTRRLKTLLRKGDTLFRTGGDEFALVVQGLDDATGAAIVAEKLLSGMRPQFTVEGEELYVGMTIGIAWYPGDAEEFGELIRKSDEALVEAKKDRYTYRFFTSEIQSTAAHHVSILNALRAGLDKQEFYLAYQAIMGADKKVIGAEALLRWKTAEFEEISPEQFIPVAESSGFIQELGGWVLAEAAEKRAELAGYGFAGFLSVNISAFQLRNPGFMDLVRSVIQRHGIEPGWLHFELTESSLMATDGIAVEVLQKLRNLGITLAIDDFGKGYSSLTYLRHLPVEMLKIDRSFILGMLESAEDRSIIESISRLAEGLGLKVIAEGVETDAHFKSVRESRCHAYQGYLFSRPVAYDAFVRLLQ